MSDDNVNAGPAPASPHAHIMQIMGSVQVARALSVVAELGIADRLAERPMTAGTLAEILGVHAGSLYRLLRMLAGRGFFAEDEGGRFLLRAPAEPLLTRTQRSLRDVVRLGWQDVMWASYGRLLDTLKSGEPGFKTAYGADFFDYLARHPDLNRCFDAAMAVASAPENDSIARSFDFGAYRSVVDVGGGTGGLLAALLIAFPNLEGVLFDQPQVVADPAPLREAGVLGRARIVPGDFFRSVPSGCDLYVMKRILHDWDDDAAIRILTRCREAMDPRGRVLAAEAVLRPGNEPDPNKNLDVGMMVLTRGRERTAEDFGALYRRAGLRLVRVIETPPPSTLSLIEGAIAED